MSGTGGSRATDLDGLREQARGLAHEPGVYLFRDGAGDVLYVGKAKSLRSRVGSYFGAEASRSVKLIRLVREIDSIETFPVRSEAEALLLEWNLIREFGPRFNIQLRDDKSYPYIKITITEPFPRIFVTRRLKDDGSRYLGPFTDVGAMRRALRTIKKMYTVRSCHYRMPDELPPRPCLDYHIGRCKAPCAGLQSEADYRKMIDEILEILGGRTGAVRRSVERRMAEAAEALEYERAGELRDVLRGLDQLEGRQAAIDPRGGSHDVIGFARQAAGGAVCGIVLRVREGRLVGRRIHYLANVGDEPDEAVLGALVKGYYLRQADDVPSELLVPEPFDEQDLVEEYFSGVADRRFRIRVPVRGPKLDLTRAANRNAAHVLERDRVERGDDSRDGSGTTGPPAAGARLGEALELQAPVRDIVCFDVSTLAGRESVGSCVWLRDGQPHKDEYRKFRIRDSEEGHTDDYAMMQEIVSRYFDRRVREGRTLPDLVVVDGGRGQLSAARQAMDGAGVSDLPTVALAKREEEVFRPGAPAPLRLPRTDPGLHWLQRARDEAHRFALHYNRTLRSRRALRSRLSEIPGVGPEREQRLLERFGSLDLIRRATPAQLARTPGIGHATATSILASLREDDPAQGVDP
ncbi:excinuclease ABC subunit UvrC [Candidatus Palauibacter sp.]|uniref:excinuclease ABC subunit UvrC n=1 Tax=Candidatus Palauibacter sp. TaxID=3101350 RepID=UPI003B529DC0